MKLHEAHSLAEKVKPILTPFCDRVELSGLARRACDEVHGLHFVCLPKPDQLDALQQRCSRTADVVQATAAQMIIRLVKAPYAGVLVEFYFARQPKRELFGDVPGNFGALLLSTTGPADYFETLAARAKSMGLLLNPYRGLFAETEHGGSKLIAAATEEDIFQALGMEFVPPALRESSREGAKEAKPEGTDWSESFSTTSEPSLTSHLRGHP